MNIEKNFFDQNVHLDGTENESVDTSTPERSVLDYRKAVQRMQELEEALPEMELLFRERPVRSLEEAVMSARDSFSEGIVSEKEAATQRKEAQLEQYWERMRQYEEARTTILGIYFDICADDGGGVLAELIRQDNPWIEKMVSKGKETWPEFNKAA